MDAGVDLTTPYGTVRLIYAGPSEIRVEAGGASPLVVHGLRVCVSLGFGYHHETRRFGLLAESRPAAWSPDGLRLDRETWQAAAGAAVAATEAHLSERRGITALAETSLLRQRLAGMAPDAVDRLSLVGQIDRSRRGLMACVG